jgi:hypothetical protein
MRATARNSFPPGGAQVGSANAELGDGETDRVFFDSTGERFRRVELGDSVLDIPAEEYVA